VNPQDLLRFASGLGVIALFDPALVQQRVRAPSDWWRRGEAEELVDGRVLLGAVTEQEELRFRLGSLDLLITERPFERERITGLPLRIESGELFIGPAERLPGDGRGERFAALRGQGRVIPVPAGDYRVSIVALDWAYDDSFYDHEGEVLAGAPADFVLLFEKGLASARHSVEVPDLMALRRREIRPVVAPAPGAPRAAPRAAPSRRPIRRPGAPGAVTSSRHQRPPRPPMSVSSADPEPIAEAVAVELWPLDTGLQRACWERDVVLKKLTRVREQLRVLEQKQNSSGSLRLSEKLELQASVSAVYRALVDLSRGLGVPL
jgi:hypothetical protein